MSKNLLLPSGYKPLINLKQTELAIKQIKDFFQENLAAELKLRRITAPLFVLKGTGINDDLNGIERPVSFPIKDMGDVNAEIVHSLAKWKRMALAELKIQKGYGIYTDMNAIRPDEDLDNLHSLYVDQWDWERVMKNGERNLDYLKKTVEGIFNCLKRTEYLVYEHNPVIKPVLPDEIKFIHTEELLKKYPDKTPLERENEEARINGAIFVIGIGGKLPDGSIHDGRAPDYDDWTTQNNNGSKGLNGDIIVWNHTLNRSFELSSMGIRVDKETMLKQLEIRGLSDRVNLAWHKSLINGEFPQSIGGGIGQSRLSMYLLKKAHIGEIQASIWPEEMLQTCAKHNIPII